MLRSNTPLIVAAAIETEDAPTRSLRIFSPAVPLRMMSARFRGTPEVEEAEAVVEVDRGAADNRATVAGLEEATAGNVGRAEVVVKVGKMGLVFGIADETWKSLRENISCMAKSM